MKKLTLFSLLLLTLGVFILNKLLHIEWYYSLGFTIIFLLILSNFIPESWDKQIINSKIFKKYFEVMLSIESYVFSLNIILFGLWCFIITFNFCWLSDILNKGFIEFIVLGSFLFITCYTRLRTQLLTINDLAQNFINKVSADELEKHFYKMFGVKFNLNPNSVYVLFGKPKKMQLQSVRQLFVNAAKYIGTISATTSTGYIIYTRDIEVGRRNQRILQEVEAVQAEHNNLFEQVVNSSLLDHKKVEVLHAIRENTNLSSKLLDTVEWQNYPLLRMFLPPLYRNSEFLDNMDQIALNQGKIARILKDASLSDTGKLTDVSFSDEAFELLFKSFFYIIGV